MKPCQDTRELLPWYLNGTLEEIRRVAIDAHLASCEACRAELEETRIAVAVAVQHLPAEALVAHVAGRDIGVDSELFETHLAACEECAEELALLRESHTALLGESVDAAPAEVAAAGSAGVQTEDRTSSEQKVLAWRPRQKPAEAGKRSRPRTGRVAAWRRGAVAAALVAVVAGTAAMNARRQAVGLAERLAALDGPRINVALVDLYPDEMVLRGGTSDTPPAEVPAAAERATLILNSRQPSSSGPYRVEIRDLDGQEVQVIDGLTTDADGLLTLSVATASLEGERILVLLDPASEEPLEAYRVRTP